MLQLVKDMLKQPQYSPLKVEEQVCVIYAGTKGFVDAIKVDDVVKFEAALLAELRGNGADILTSIRDSQKLDDAAEVKLKTLVEGVVKGFA